MSGALRIAAAVTKVAAAVLRKLGPPVAAAFRAVWKKAGKWLGHAKKVVCALCKAPKYHSISDAELRQKNIEALNELKTEKNAMSKRRIKAEIGPAHAIVHNRRNGKTYSAINNPKGDLPTPTHPYTLEKFNNLKNNHPDIYENYLPFTHGPGSHAEVNAVNRALNADPNATIDDLTVDVIRTGSTKETAGTAFKQCPHCESMLQSIKSPSQH